MNQISEKMLRLLGESMFDAIDIELQRQDANFRSNRGRTMGALELPKHGTFYFVDIADAKQVAKKLKDLDIKASVSPVQGFTSVGDFESGGPLAKEFAKLKADEKAAEENAAAKKLDAVKAKLAKYVGSRHVITKRFKEPSYPYNYTYVGDVLTVRDSGSGAEYALVRTRKDPKETWGWSNLGFYKKDKIDDLEELLKLLTTYTKPE